ncbi:MAG: hypothetical protein ACRDTX_17025 [Pseudonocardiaceae bacterium]
MRRRRGIGGAGLPLVVARRRQDVDQSLQRGGVFEPVTGEAAWPGGAGGPWVSLPCSAAAWIGSWVTASLSSAAVPASVNTS